MELDPKSKQNAPLVGRRELLKALGATGAAVAAVTVLPGEWAAPMMKIGVLPVHAQGSPTPTPPAPSACIPIPSPIDMVLTVDASGSIGAGLGVARQALLNFVARERS